ncbi:MAG: radical SAM protein [Alphaproteobacteria bacterium]|uniref:Radical SAM protein n=1 Tax=Candidatus Nitrobium versatile TaxID=2884831 RepID=A0A953M0M4_9BACT|nr:radical SAM protein [Candidatus Nitrobium versatile]
MLLIYPPVAKACEPPAGVARIAGVLHRHGAPCRVVDANLEGMLHLLDGRSSLYAAQYNTWTRRAFRNVHKNLASLREPSFYRGFDRYKKAVHELNRALEMPVCGAGATVSLGNYHHRELSPVQSGDLLRAAEHPESNPFFPYFSMRLPALLEEDRPSLVGFSLNYLNQALCAFAMIGFLRRECPGVAVVLGGGLVTSWMRNPRWRDPFAGLVDRCIAGPGERPLLSLMGYGVDGEDPGPPEYSTLPLHDYLAPGTVLPYSASSGCYWNKCSFCPERAEGNPYAPVPVPRALRDITSLVRETRPVLLHLLDNALSVSLMRGLAENPPGVPWYGFARIGSELTDRDFCRALRRSGCVMLKLGVESGDQEVLDALQKGIELERVSKVLKTVKEAGIAAYVYLLFGTPAETVSSARKTLAFVARHAGEIRFLNCALFNMPVSGHEAREMATGAFYEGDLALYTNFAHPKGWDRRQVRQFLEGEFKRHRAVSAILKNDPPFFTSNHAAFFSGQEE